MRYIFSLLLLLVILPSCHSHRKAMKRKVAQQRAAEAKKPVVRKITVEEYIAAHKNAAVSNMRKYGIPASIILSQGILESANGNSNLARYANNHFGIKCTNEWKGKTYYMNDDRPNECFRKYPSVEASYQDHVDFLKRPRYAALFNLRTKDYKGWANGLKKAGYATNPKYPELLIAIIEKYGLHKYD